MAKVPCCSKCKDIGYCRTTASCCLECHFAFEEKKAAPYLTPSEMSWLRSQHKWLKEQGFPPDAVNRHASAEMHLFRKKCPAEICRLISGDHDEYEHGRLRVRDLP